MREPIRSCCPDFYMYIIAFVHIPNMQTHTLHIIKYLNKNSMVALRKTIISSWLGMITVTELKAEEEKKSLSTVWYNILGFCNVQALLQLG